MLPPLGAYRGTYPAGPPLPKPPLVLWFRARWAVPRPSLTSSAWVDAHGCRIRSGIEFETLAEVPSDVPAGNPLPGGPQRNPVLWAAAPAVIPRRGTAPLPFAAFDPNGGAPTATYPVPPLPEVADPPGWSGFPPPLSATQGDTTFTLTDLRHLPPQLGPFSRSEATFRFSGTGPHSRKWRPAMVTVLDAAGNRLPTTLYQHLSPTVGERGPACRKRGIPQLSRL